ncbi:MAG: hypothetical protein AAF449_23475, partial [Myxococcota bacterium]
LATASAVLVCTASIAQPANTRSGHLLAASYGGDDVQGLGACAGQVIDGVPVIFDRPIARRSLDAGDFVIVTADGQRVQPQCVTFFPSINGDEGQTILTQGVYGNPQASPVAVEIVGSVQSTDGLTEYNGASISIVPWEVGAILAYARRLDLASALGGFDQCPNGTAQVVQLAFGSNAGNNFPATADYLSRFTLMLEGGGTVAPVGFADITVDNYLELCLDTPTDAVAITIAEETIVDASGQFNEGRLFAPIE